MSIEKHSKLLRNMFNNCIIDYCWPCYLLHIDASSQVALTASSEMSESNGCLDAIWSDADKHCVTYTYCNRMNTNAKC